MYIILCVFLNNKRFAAALFKQILIKLFDDFNIILTGNDNFICVYGINTSQ